MSILDIICERFWCVTIQRLVVGIQDVVSTLEWYLLECCFYIKFSPKLDKLWVRVLKALLE